MSIESDKFHELSVDNGKLREERDALRAENERLQKLVRKHHQRIKALEAWVESLGGIVVRDDLKKPAPDFNSGGQVKAEHHVTGDCIPVPLAEEEP